MTILTPPAALSGVLTGLRMGLRTNTAAFTSDLDGTTQTLERPGAFWHLEGPLKIQTSAQFDAWIAFLLALDGMNGRVYIGDPMRQAPLGSAAATPGTPKVKGASQTGKALAVDGLPASATGYLLAGDYFALPLPSGGRSMHRLVADADSDGAGEATFAFRPPLRESPADNADIVVTSATCVMRLLDDAQAAWSVQPGGGGTGLYSASIAFVESFNTGA